VVILNLSNRVRHLFILFVLALPLSLSAQTVRVEGTITNGQSETLEGVAIIFRNQTVYTDSRGFYQMLLPANKETKILFTLMGYFPDSLRIYPTQETRLVRNITLIATQTVIDQVDIIAERNTPDGGVKIKPRDLEFSAGPLSTVEGLIKTLPGVVSRSEFSSQYSVRGGSFDENLVYVNGFEVYRPFLARSGQQEGLSFVNSAMVDDIYFSAGGFAPRYGDKMSSVLDITYREPEPFGIRAQGSFLGGSMTAEGRTFKDKLGVMVSGRYRTNQVLLGQTDLQADYRPRFTDVQALLSYRLSDEWHFEFLGNYARNNFQVIPQTSSTKFGTLNEALQLNVFFEGQEQYFYTTRFGAVKATFRPERNIQLDFIATAYQTVEEELTDVIGYYRLAELNNNLGSDEFGDVKLLRGVGAFQSYLRNRLDAIVVNAEHKGMYITKAGTLRWGMRWQRDDILDRYKEWERIDSAGYAVPHRPSAIDSIFNDTTIFYTPAAGLPLWESYDSRAGVISHRITGYLDFERTWQQDSSIWQIIVGARSHYWTFNNQITVSPRTSISYTPGKRKYLTWRLAGGYYHQPPFYREFRDIQGGLNPEILAQLAIHAVLGLDYQFKMWNRPFKLATEAYYKAMRNLIPYEIDNVRIRYSAQNEADGFAAGIDLRINGEFVKGTESWASLSLFRVLEDLSTDNSGYIPRPTDTRFNFAIFFQDYLPGDPTFRVSLNLYVTGGFPFGAPQTPRAEQVFRAPPYRRVDLGFIKVLKEEGKDHKWKTLNSFRSVWIGVEVFNLLQSRNTVSYLWVRDVSSARQYAVPNYLTARLLNIKLTLKI
jgi:hypothetical protein